MAKHPDTLLEIAKTAKKESKYLDFKRGFDVTSTESWCEVIKDVVALGNSGGGIIIFGVEDDGSYSRVDCQAILAVDLADIVNKLEAYTKYQYSGIEMMPIKRGRNICAGLLIPRSEIPVIFTSPGTYPIPGNKQKTAFARGTVYFRHGAKSEPGNIHDLLTWRDNEISRIRKSWMGDIRKVVTKPSGSILTVVPPTSNQVPHGSRLIPQMTNDPSAPSFIPGNTEELWPHRRKDLLDKINSQIKGIKINGFDIQCINHNNDVFIKRRDFAHKPHKLSGPQYSDTYVDWIVGQWRADRLFFKKMREQYSRN